MKGLTISGKILHPTLSYVNYSARDDSATGGGANGPVQVAC